MGYRTQRLLRGLSIASLLVAAGSTVAAMNWHGIWRSAATVDAEHDPPTSSLGAVEAQATFQQWVVVALVGLALALACSLVLSRARADQGAPVPTVGRRARRGEQ